jgi:hypothetical protein
MSNLQPQTRAWTSSSESEDWHDIPSDLDSSSAARPVDINHHVQASLVDQDVQASIVDLNPVIPPGGEQQHTDSPSSGVLVASEKKKCWICLAEEGEAFIDGSPINTSRWSKACACSLDAHENCLITWINQSRGGDANKAVLSTFSELIFR